jgi:hypothetical protein
LAVIALSSAQMNGFPAEIANIFTNLIQRVYGRQYNEYAFRADIATGFQAGKALADDCRKLFISTLFEMGAKVRGRAINGGAHFAVTSPCLSKA